MALLRTLQSAAALEVSALAERCQILLPSMSGVVRRLEARDLVVRSANEQDKRSSLVSLSPAPRV